MAKKHTREYWQDRVDTFVASTMTMECATEHIGHDDFKARVDEHQPNVGIVINILQSTLVDLYSVGSVMTAGKIENTVMDIIDQAAKDYVSKNERMPRL